MKADAIIQIRLGSTRLKKKAQLKLNGVFVYDLIIDICKHSCNIDRIILAVPDTAEDVNFFEKVAADNEIYFFAGSEENVLSRYYHAALRYSCNDIVRITADDPLKDPAIIDKIIDKYFSNYPGYDYVSNTITPTFPEGLDCEVFKFKALERAYNEAKDPVYLEHVTTYIWMHPEKFNLFNFENETDYSGLRWTLDTPDDLKFFEAVFKRLYSGRPIPWKSVLNLIKEEPSLKEINSGTERYAGLKKHKIKLETEK